MRSRIPFYKQISLYALKIKKVVYKSPRLEPTTKLLSSPKLLTKFAPVSPMIRQSSRPTVKPPSNPNSILNRLAVNASASKDEEKTRARGTLSKYTPWIDRSKAKNLPVPTDLNTEAVRLPNAKANLLAPTKTPTTAELLRSPSLFLRGIDRAEESKLVYCECGSVCTSGESVCEACVKGRESVEHSGYLYLKDKSSQLKRYWCILLNKELYCNFIC